MPILDVDDPLVAVTPAEFKAFRDVKFGRANPERMENPLWLAMVECGYNAYYPRTKYDVKFRLRDQRPIWCFDRMGMSQTLLPDKSIVFIGGEHEYGYDPDFCIYNDVIVRRWDRSTEIYGYPPTDFQPTDFHSATLVDNLVYIVGSLGRPSDRIVGETHVYTLELSSMLVRRISVLGEEPSWIHRHEALFDSGNNRIVVWGGSVMPEQDKFCGNDEMWAFSLRDHKWERIENALLDQSTERWRGY